MPQSFIEGFKKTAFLGKLLSTAFVGMEGADVLSKARNFGNKRIGSMKAPSFYSHRRLPKMPMYK